MPKLSPGIHRGVRLKNGVTRDVRVDAKGKWHFLAGGSANAARGRSTRKESGTKVKNGSSGRKGGRIPVTAFAVPAKIAGHLVAGRAYRTSPVGQVTYGGVLEAAAYGPAYKKSGVVAGLMRAYDIVSVETIGRWPGAANAYLTGGKPDPAAGMWFPGNPTENLVVAGAAYGAHKGADFFKVNNAFARAERALGASTVVVV